MSTVVFKYIYNVICTYVRSNAYVYVHIGSWLSSIQTRVSERLVPSMIGCSIGIDPALLWVVFHSLCMEVSMVAHQNCRNIVEKLHACHLFRTGDRQCAQKSSLINVVCKRKTAYFELGCIASWKVENSGTVYWFAICGKPHACNSCLCH